MNSVNISGNLTRLPDLRETTGGTSILTFGVAVNDRRKNPQTGDWEDVPNFVDCVLFGKRAESLSKILTKGMKVAVSGRLRYSSWEKDGQRRSKLEVVADDVDIMQRRGDGSGGSYGGGSGNHSYGGGNGSQNGSQAATEPSHGYDDMYSDDIPF